MKKITPFLWFEKDAEEAAKFYVSLFPNSAVTMASPMMVNFTLDGQDFMALNGGPEYSFTPAISMFVSCENQEEVDMYWGKLSADSESEQCGWCKDKYGLSWQIIPKQFMELVSDPDPVKSKSVMDAMLKMKKLIVSDLQAAHDGK
jgi:predicted 3-demethylubiquinone-9 3-methyltransferase (glyoxalase superfamily)